MEYYTIYKNWQDKLEAADLNHMYAQNGWELITVVPTGQRMEGLYYYFKRSK